MWRDTLRALAEPRRAVPIGALAVVMLAAQAWLNPSPVARLGGVVAVVGFVLTAPYLWRRWRPLAGGGEPLAGVVLLGCVAAPIVGAIAVPHGADSLLTAGLNGVVVSGLYLVGGWGLAHTIELERRADTYARLAANAELLALKAQLDPHFLFNTLNAIAEWCAQDPAVAEAALLRLSGVLRDVFAGARGEAWPLARELALAREVCELYALRDPARFATTWRVGTVPAIVVPPLLLLPAIENAFTHGAGAGHRGAVDVSIEDGATVVIRNPGPPGPPREGGAGLSILRRRAALFGAVVELRGVGGLTELRVVLQGGARARPDR